MLIFVIDILFVYEKELKYFKVIFLKIIGIYIIKMEFFNFIYYLIINNVWEIKLLNKYIGEIIDFLFGELFNVYDLYKDFFGCYWVFFYG